MFSYVPEVNMSSSHDEMQQMLPVRCIAQSEGWDPCLLFGTAAII